jgi:Ca2+-binding RTX toxin-like protein
MGGGNDKWTAIEDPITCAAGPALNVVYPIDNNGYRLTISGEGGNDTMSIGIGIGDAVGSVGEHGMCGGSGDDRMTGGYDPQIIYGHSGHDYMYGGRQNDTLRGSTGQDVALHPSNEQTDLIQTEGDVDCVYINGPVQSGSSCGTGADRYDVDGSTMSSCGTSTPDCCSISPAC